MVTISTYSLLISGGLVTGYLLQREPNKSVCQRAENLILTYQKTNLQKILQESNIDGIKKSISQVSMNKSEFSNLLEKLEAVNKTIDRRYNNDLKPWNKTVLMGSMHQNLNISFKEASLIDTLLQYSKIINADHLTMEELYYFALTAIEKDNVYPLITLHNKIESGLQFIQSQKPFFRYAAFSALEDHLQKIQNQIKYSGHYIAEKRSRKTDQEITKAKKEIEQVKLTAESAQRTAQSAHSHAMIASMRR